MKQETYKITGMSCAACSSAVERVTRKLPGVVRSDVNLTTAKLRIEYDEKQVAPEQIIAKIEKAGFGAEVFSEDAEKRKKEAEAQARDLSESRRRLFLSVIFAVPLLYLSMGHMVPFPLPLPGALDMELNPLAFALAQLVLTVPILIFGRNFYLHGFPALFRGNPNMDSLVAIGTMAAFLYSLVMTVLIPRDTHYVHQLYYESAAVVVTLIMLGKYMEKRSKGKTSEAIRKLMALAPDTAIRLKDGAEQEVRVEELAPGDIILIRSGARIPLDGVIVSGSGSVDESMLTGESLPVDKAADSEVIGGSLNYDGLFQVRVTRTGADTTLAKIVQLMEDAQGKKAPISKVADKVAGYFVPAVILIALAAAVIWLIAGKDFSFVLRIFVSVLVIACPCALGLATPTAIMVGTGLGAQNGILVKSGEALETAQQIDAVVLDKTGTITEGRPKVIAVLCGEEEQEGVGAAGNECGEQKREDAGTAGSERGEQKREDAGTAGSERGEQKQEGAAEPGNEAGVRAEKAEEGLRAKARRMALLSAAAGAEAGSEHPLARAILDEARAVGAEICGTAEFRNLAGYGVYAKLADGREVWLGKAELAEQHSGNAADWREQAEQLAAKGQTPMYVVVDGRTEGLISVADPIKATSAAAIDALKQDGLRVYMLTGDNRRTAEFIGAQAHVDEVTAEVLPQDKAGIIEELQKQGKRVMMVGDGINDAPALVQAEVGCAIGSGSDIAIDSADIVLMKSDLMDVHRAIRLSRLTIRNIRQNLFWAFFYNTIGIPVAAGLLFPSMGLLLNPMLGGFAMSLSSVCVVSNALRLRFQKL